MRCYRIGSCQFWWVWHIDICDLQKLIFLLKMGFVYHYSTTKSIIHTHLPICLSCIARLYRTFT